MRSQLKYLNAIEHLKVSNYKEEVTFYMFNYNIAHYSLRQFIEKDGLTIKKEGVDIKGELEKTIKRIESHFQLNYSDFLRLMECLDKFKEYNMKYDISVRDDEIVVYFNKIKVHEPDKLRHFGAYFYKHKNCLYQGYVNSDKFYITPLWDNKKATIDDYLDFFEKALATAPNMNPNRVLGF